MQSTYKGDSRVSKSGKPSEPGKKDLSTKVLLKKNLKILLYRLAAESESPSKELEMILQECMTELYQDAKMALSRHEDELAKKRRHLRLLPSTPLDLNVTSDILSENNIPSHLSTPS